MQAGKRQENVLWHMAGGTRAELTFRGGWQSQEVAIEPFRVWEDLVRVTNGCRQEGASEARDAQCPGLRPPLNV